MNAPRVFDMEHYEPLNTGRIAALENVLPPLVRSLSLRTALDVGCGLGFFSACLNSVGLNVLGLDGRQMNVDEARRRIPDIRFELGDIEDRQFSSAGSDGAPPHGYLSSILES